MRTIQLVIFSAFFPLVFASCGGISSSIMPASDISNIIPDEIFYQTTGSCENRNLTFNVLIAGGELVQADAQLLGTQTNLYLNKDGTYLARYIEFEPGTSTNTYMKKISGTYQVNYQTGSINLENLGYGSVQTINGKHYLQLQYAGDVYSKGLHGQITQFRLYHSLFGLDTDRSKYCNY